MLRGTATWGLMTVTMMKLSKRYDIVLQTVSFPTIIQNKWLRVSFLPSFAPRYINLIKSLVVVVV